MKRSKLLAAAVCALLLAGPAAAQSPALQQGPAPTLPHPTGEWTLQECIAYAVEHNISVQQSKLRMEQSRITHSTAKRNRLPSLDASMNGSMGFGRSEIEIVDPDTDISQKVLKDVSTFSSGANVSASLPIFQGLRIKHNIESSKFNLAATLEDIGKVAEEVSLSVTSFYLQTLFNREMVGVAMRQVEISEALVAANEIKYREGKIPEADLVESRSQLARDRYSLVQQQNTFDLSILDLKQMLNLEASEAFDVAQPNTSDIALMSMASRETVENIYDYALGTRPVILGEENRLKASLANIRVVKGQLYPTISASAGYSNRYYYNFSGDNIGFADQVRKNGSETIGLGMSIPIFNRGITRNNIRSATVSANAQELSLLQAKQTLRKEIEQAYYKATSALSQYVSSKESAEAALKSFGYEQRKAEAQVSTLYDFDLAKNRLAKAESEMVQAKYEYIFRTKILEFYKGEELRFDY